MKAFVLRKHKTLHAISLVVLIASFFVQNFALKLALMIVACAGMAVIFNAKDQKTLAIIMTILIFTSLIAGLFYYQSTL